MGTTRATGVDLHGSGLLAASIALADLEGDGNVEIIVNNYVCDHLGHVLWQAPQDAGPWAATTVADLDGDGDLEVILGHAAYHHDGTPLFETDVRPGYPQVADFDRDGTPEVLVVSPTGISLLSNDGTIRYRDLRPTQVAEGLSTWTRPAVIHDFDGDGAADYAVASGARLAAYHADGALLWSADVSDESGVAGVTAFDFLGIGSALLAYADQQELLVLDSSGAVLARTPRTSGTLSEYPVVADIDNDGAAELIVVSSFEPTEHTTAAPTVQVFEAEKGSWAPTRRIWNQHTYHVTNVGEDGTIPRHEAASYSGPNTFRANSSAMLDSVDAGCRSGGPL